MHGLSPGRGRLPAGGRRPIPGATGGAAGAHEAGAFDPIVNEVKEALPRTSALILVAENPTAEKLVSAIGPRGRVARQDMTDEQVEQLKQAAVPA